MEASSNFAHLIEGYNRHFSFGMGVQEEGMGVEEEFVQCLFFFIFFLTLIDIHTSLFTKKTRFINPT